MERDEGFILKKQELLESRLLLSRNWVWVVMMYYLSRFSFMIYPDFWN